MMPNAFPLAVTLAVFVFVASRANGDPLEARDVPFHAQGEKSGDPTQDSIILLTRLTAVEQGEIEQDVPGMDGRARFQVSETREFKTPRMTPWIEATKENDHTIKQSVTGLKPGHDYWYRVQITDASGKGERIGPTRSFKTAPAADQRRNVRFAVITGLGYEKRDNDRGHVGFHGIDKVGIDFIALTGDTLYYDGAAGGTPKSLWPPGVKNNGELYRAVLKLLNEMTDDEAVLWLRKHWHAMYALPIQREFFGKYAGYWQMDDHDYRSDDWSTHYEPGLIVFRDQNPVPDRTFRTVRWGQGLQVWFLEGRQYRNKKAKPATLWGQEQFDWLVKSLAESDATFKVIVSSSPVIGSGRGGGYNPPPGQRSDNHGYRPFLEERKAFLDRIAEHGVKDLYIVCGDRHAKYHNRGKVSRIHEFCCGSLSVRHGARGNYWPDEDVSGLVDVLHDLDIEKTGGFLIVDVDVADESHRPTINFTFHDQDGDKLDGWLFSNKVKVRERKSP